MASITAAMASMTQLAFAAPVAPAAMLGSTSLRRITRRTRALSSTSSRPAAASRPHAAPGMTLQPKDCSWRSERDLRAIESEFMVSLSTPVSAVDDDMHRLRRRMVVLSQKEKQWADVCQQFISLSLLTGIPMIDVESGEPTATAWVFLSLSAAIPLYVLCVLAQWLHSSSAIFAMSM